MRDPNRIDPMIDKLRALWHRYPDFRLGQLVVNLGRRAPDTKADTFNVEDDKMATTIDQVAKEGW